MKKRCLTAGITFLAEAGLNLFAAFDCTALPHSIAEPLLTSGVPLADYRRLACPFFPEHRYTLPQIQYHYRHSLITLQNYF